MRRSNHSSSSSPSFSPSMSSSPSSSSPTLSTSSFTPITRKKTIASQYKQTSQPGHKNYSKLNCIPVTDEYVFTISNYSHIIFPYDINILPTSNNYHHTWQINLFHSQVEDEGEERYGNGNGSEGNGRGENKERNKRSHNNQEDEKGTQQERGRKGNRKSGKGRQRNNNKNNNLNNGKSLGIYLINKMNENIYASYKIKIKNHDSELEDYLWSDPEGEVCFSSYGSGDHYWGTEELILLNELEDPQNGYLRNDEIILEIIITALVSDELRILPPIAASSTSVSGSVSGHSSSSHDDGGTHSSSNHNLSTNTALEKATKQLNNLSTQISQKIRLLSEDALLQDKLIHARLSTQQLSSSQPLIIDTGAGGAGAGEVDHLSHHSNTSPSVGNKSIHTTSHVSLHQSHK